MAIPMSSWRSYFDLFRLIIDRMRIWQVKYIGTNRSHNSVTKTQNNNISHIGKYVKCFNKMMSQTFPYRQPLQSQNIIPLYSFDIVVRFTSK